MNLSVAKDYAKQGIFNDDVVAAFRDAGYSEEYLRATYGYGESGGDGGDSFASTVLRNLQDSVARNGGLTQVQLGQLKNYVAGHMLTQQEVNDILDALGYGE